MRSCRLFSIPERAEIGVLREFAGREIKSGTEKNPTFVVPNKIPGIMSFEVIGTLLKKFDTESKSSTFQAREFVIEIADGNYPQFIKFQLVQDRCSLVDDFEEGKQIKVHFDLRGREWNGKYFTNLNAWRLEQVSQQAGSAGPEKDEEFGDPFADSAPGKFPSDADAPPETEGGDVDDLPF